VLHAAKLAVGAAHRFGEVGRNQAQFGGDPEQGDVAEVAAQPGVPVRMPEDQVLDDELDVDQAATVVLDVEDSSLPEAC
jgi:hypothetical protein